MRPNLTKTAIYARWSSRHSTLLVIGTLLSGCTTVPLSDPPESARKASASLTSPRPQRSGILATAKPTLAAASPKKPRRDAMVQSAQYIKTKSDPRDEIDQVAANVDPEIANSEIEAVEPPPRQPKSFAKKGSDRTELELAVKPALNSAHAVNLVGVLQLVDSQNPQVAFARERIQEANAQQLRADVLWLPSLRAGVNYNHHDGAIQAVDGTVFNTSRNALFTGFGAKVPGAASPAVPGLAAEFHLTDAIFQPRIAEQVACSRKASASASTNDLLLDAALAYLELQRADSELAIAREALRNTQELERVTGEYARTGQGLPSDHDRALAELAIRRNDVRRADEAIQVASARLAQLLSVDAREMLQPQEPTAVPIELTDINVNTVELVAHGLQNRPEVAEHRHLVGEAVERLNRDQFAPLIPSILLATSYGGYGGGIGSNYSSISNRFDADAVAYWEIRNLGFGERAARAEAGSRIEQARFREMAVLDRIAREVVESHTQVQARRGQIPVAREGIQAAINSHRRNLERMQNAQGLPIEVLQSIQALAQARREYLRCVIDFNRSQFSLQRALGKPIESQE